MTPFPDLSDEAIKRLCNAMLAACQRRYENRRTVTETTAWAEFQSLNKEVVTLYNIIEEAAAVIEALVAPVEAETDLDQGAVIGACDAALSPNPAPKPPSSIAVPVAPTRRYRHFKGNVYEVLMEGVRSEASLQPCVVYRDVSAGFVWVRRADEFHGTLPDGRKRFALLPGAGEAK